MNILMSLLAWFGAFSLAALLVGLGAYVAARVRRTVEPLGAPDWLPHAAWATPTRAVAATVWTAFVIVLVLAGAPIPFFDQLVAAAAIIAICGSTPAEYRVGGVLLSCIVAVVPLVAWLVVGHAFGVPYAAHAGGLLAAGLLRGLCGIPDYEYYARAPVAAPSRPVWHLVCPDDVDTGMRKRLNNKVHGQAQAIIRLTTKLVENRSFCSPISSQPFAVVAPGPDSVGKQRLFAELAAELHGRFIIPNRRADVQGDALYEALKQYRINGEPAIIYLDGLDGAPKASDLVAQYILDGHDADDDWSKAMVVIPLTTTEELPTDEAALLDKLGSRLDRKLLRAATIVPFRPLDQQALGRITVQLITDLAASKRLVVDSVSKEAVKSLFDGRDKQLPGARSIQAPIKTAVNRCLEKAVLAGHKNIIIDTSPSGELTVVPVTV